jgi:hypothetical protein
MSAMLDQALAPTNPPPDLADRIIALTTPQLRRRRTVLYRILPQLRAMAASIILAAMFGIGYFGAQIVDSAHGRVQVQRTLVSIGAYRGPNAAIDNQIQLLAAQVDLAATAPAWDSQVRALDQAVTEWEASAANNTSMF